MRPGPHNRIRFLSLSRPLAASDDVLMCSPFMNPFYPT